MEETTVLLIRSDFDSKAEYIREYQRLCQEYKYKRHRVVGCWEFSNQPFELPSEETGNEST